MQLVMLSQSFWRRSHVFILNILVHLVLLILWNIMMNLECFSSSSWILIHHHLSITNMNLLFIHDYCNFASILLTT